MTSHRNYWKCSPLGPKMANISPGLTAPSDARASSITFPPCFSPCSASFEFVFRAHNFPPLIGITYPTFSHLTPIPPLCTVAGPPLVARLCDIFPKISTTKRPKMMPPTTAKPAITPPLSCCPDVALVAVLELVASINDCATHSPKVQPDRERPCEPNRDRRTCWSKEQGVPEVDEEFAQFMSSAPDSVLIVWVRSNA
jgi:hypothetical protein